MLQILHMKLRVIIVSVHRCADLSQVGRLVCHLKGLYSAGFTQQQLLKHLAISVAGTPLSVAGTRLSLVNAVIKWQA